MLSAIRSTGVIEDASIVFDGPTDATVFRQAEPTGEPEPETNTDSDETADPTEPTST